MSFHDPAGGGADHPADRPDHPAAGEPSAVPAGFAAGLPARDAGTAAQPGTPGAPDDGTGCGPTELKFPFPDHGCFGCSATNSDGLQLRFFNVGSELRATYRIADRFHGAPGIAHGGIAATILDEFSCAAAIFFTGSRVVTGEMTVRYEKPCPVEEEIEIVARIASRDHPRYMTIEAEIRRNGQRLVMSTGKFFPLPIAEPAP